MTRRYYFAISQFFSHYFNQHPPQRYTQLHLKIKVPPVCEHDYLMCLLLKDGVLNLLKPMTLPQVYYFEGKKAITKVRFCSCFVLIKVGLSRIRLSTKMGNIQRRPAAAPGAHCGALPVQTSEERWLTLVLAEALLASRQGWMGLRAASSSGRCLHPCQGVGVR